MIVGGGCLWTPSSNRGSGDSPHKTGKFLLGKRTCFHNQISLPAACYPACCGPSCFPVAALEQQDAARPAWTVAAGSTRAHRHPRRNRVTGQGGGTHTLSRCFSQGSQWKKIKKSPLLALLLPLCCPPTNTFPDFLPHYCPIRNSISTLPAQYRFLIKSVFNGHIFQGIH